MVSDNNSNFSNNNDTIVGVLGYWPTEEKQMWSHLELLDKLPKEESLKMVSKCSSPPFTLSLSSSFPPLSLQISFGYGHLEGAYHGRWNTSLSLPNPRFSWNEDPTRYYIYSTLFIINNCYTGSSLIIV